MRSYERDIKSAALESIKAIGVAKTSEQMNISVQTLYKWRKCASVSSEGGDDSVALGGLDGDYSELKKRLDELEEQNAALSRQLAEEKAQRAEEGKKYRRRILQLIKALQVFMQPEE